MNEKRVKDLMVSLDQYPLVSEEATLLEAIEKLEEMQKKRNREMQPYRAVLIVDKNGKVVGKLGELAFLKSLEPQQNLKQAMQKMSDAGVSEQTISTAVGHYNFFQENFHNLCMRASHIKVKDVMRPLKESIDEEALLCEAIIQILKSDTLSILVTRKGEIVGLLRISDMCHEVARAMRDNTSPNGDKTLSK